MNCKVITRMATATSTSTSLSGFWPGGWEEGDPTHLLLTPTTCFFPRDPRNLLYQWTNLKLKRLSFTSLLPAAELLKCLTTKKNSENSKTLTWRTRFGRLSGSLTRRAMDLSALLSWQRWFSFFVSSSFLRDLSEVERVSLPWGFNIHTGLIFQRFAVQSPAIWTLIVLNYLHLPKNTSNQDWLVLRWFWIHQFQFRWCKLLGRFSPQRKLR